MMAAEFLGPLIIDVLGHEVSEQEYELLNHPLVGGVILFARNFSSKAQLQELVSSLKSVKQGRLLLMADQEGGRVQRFKEGFSLVPAMGSCTSANQAYELAATLASELISVGLDLNLGPVLDVDYGLNSVIGPRSFGSSAAKIIEYAHAYIDGLNSCGMAAVGKHFPGHGGVSADSHLSLPVDNRTLDSLWQADLLPFYELHAKLGGVMTAHLHFPKISKEIVTFAPQFIKDILRDQIGYQGVVISDDLSMQAAQQVHSCPVARVQAALASGCDLALLCNNRSAVIKVLQELDSVSTVIDTTMKINSLRLGHDHRV